MAEQSVCRHNVGDDNGKRRADESTPSTRLDTKARRGQGQLHFLSRMASANPKSLQQTLQHESASK